jgi:hypothetical protein
MLNVSPPLSNVCVQSRVQSRVPLRRILGWFVRRQDTYTYLIGDPALLYKSRRSDDLPSIRGAPFSCHTLKLGWRSSTSGVQVDEPSALLSRVISSAWLPRRLSMTSAERYQSQSLAMRLAGHAVSRLAVGLRGLSTQSVLAFLRVCYQ